MYQHTLIIKGNPRDLDDIFNKLGMRPEVGQVIKHGDPADITPTKEQMSQLMGGKPLLVGTTRLEIRFNGNKEEFKAFVLARFPKVQIS